MRRLSVLLIPLLLLAGCSVGDIRRPAPTPPDPSVPPQTPEPAPAVPVPADEVRRASVSVPGDFDWNGVEFTDAERGYAQFVQCGRAARCTAKVLSTTDGGRSWQQLRHPQLVANNPEWYASGDHLMLSSEPDDWYISADRGRTFRHERSPRPPDAWPPFGRFGIASGQVVEWADDRAKPVPVQPPLPELARVVYADGRLIVVGLQDDRPYAMLSLDHGKTWQQIVVATDDKVSWFRTLTSSDGRDVFLIGHARDLHSFPLLWRLDGYRWEPVEAAGHPRQIDELAAIGDGMLVAAGPSGSGIIIDGRYEVVGWPLSHQVKVLDDGTLLSVHPDDSVWLGTGHAADRRWIKLTFGW